MNEPRHTFRDALIERFARAVTGRPVVTLVVCAVVAVVALGYTAVNLEYHSDRSALVDPEVSWQKRYAAYKERFPRWDDLIVAVDLSGSGEATAGAFLRELREALLVGESGFREVTIGYDADAVRADALLSRDVDAVREAVASIQSSSPVLGAADVTALVGLSNLLGTNLSDEQRGALGDLLARAGAVAQGGEGKLLDGGGERLELLTTGTGNIAFALVERSWMPLDESIETVRQSVRELLATPGFAALEAGVTGVPVLESDETVQSTKDATFASVLSLSLIAVLMMIVYRRVEVPILAIVALLLGVGASFGWVTLAVGHLQVLSVVFAVVLLGLGIDTAIHFIARLELVHADHDHMRGALVRTFRGVGPGVLTGALTTAAAFGATAFTEFTGVAEMGLIASGGVLICTVFVVAVFSAVMVLVPKPEKRIRSREGGEGKPFMGSLGVWMDGHARVIVGVSVVVLGGCAWLASGVRYDPDLIKLMPANAESVRWERRISADDAQSVWNAVVIAEGEDEVRAVIARFRDVPEVAGVGGAAEIIDGGADLAEKLEIARTLPDVSSVAPSSGADLGAFRGAIGALADRWDGVDDRIAGLAASLAGTDDAGLARVSGAYVREREALIGRIRVLRESAGPSLDSLPSALRELVVSDRGEGDGVLLRVYPHAPPAGTTVLSPENLEPFAEAVLRVAPDATGPTIQIYESSKLITRSYANAALLALAAIVVLLLIDFRNVFDAACALVPVLAGTVVMLAVMALIGEPLNFANTIVMPLIAGLGVDAGVHAVHRWRAQPEGQPAGLAGGTGRAIGITTLTTVIGFACMMTAEHRGIQSLGLVMSVGLVAVWVSAVTVLPGVLRVRKGHMANEQMGK